MDPIMSKSTQKIVYALGEQLHSNEWVAMLWFEPACNELEAMTGLTDRLKLWGR